MGGFLIDVFVMFVVKSIAYTRGFGRSERWQRVSATAFDVAIRDPDIGCPSVVLGYEAVANDRRLRGKEEIPFFLRWRAERYAQLLSANPSLTVRVNHDTQETRFFEVDQER